MCFECFGDGEHGWCGGGCNIGSGREGGGRTVRGRGGGGDGGTCGSGGLGYMLNV